MEIEIRIDKNGRLTLPKYIRNALNIKTNSNLIAIIGSVEDGIVLKAANSHGRGGAKK